MIASLSLPLLCSTWKPLYVVVSSRTRLYNSPDDIICNIANMFNLQRLCDKIVIMGDFNIGNDGNAFLNESLFSNYLICI